MICAKNYETVSKDVKVMPKILWFLFSGHGVGPTYYHENSSQLSNDIKSDDLKR